jgi:Protein of unknown function with HXXEE motif
MRFIWRHWYSLGLVLGIVAVLCVLLIDMGTVRVILLLNFVALLLHQFEEYAWPGGFPWIMNEVMRPKGNHPDRYPLSQNNAFFINVGLAYPFYMIPVFFPDVVWLGLAPVLFGIGQLFMHGIVGNWKLKSFYSPGLAAVALGHVPLGIWYIIEVYRRGMITPLDWVFAVVYMALFMGLGMMKIGYGTLAHEDSPYPFTPEELNRFNRPDHLARIANARTR